jgi:hypothetical protein
MLSVELRAWSACWSAERVERRNHVYNVLNGMFSTK